MNYKDIEKLVNQYGEDYLTKGDIAKIFSIIKDSPSMQSELEQGITDEWLDALKQSGKIFVYTDYRKESCVNTSNKKYPFIECTFQDVKDFENSEKPAEKVPVVRYVCKLQRLNYSLTSIAKETEYRMRLKSSYEDKEK